MKATQLIDTAKKAGMGIGRKGRDLYYWWTFVGETYVEETFRGSRKQFEAFVVARAMAAR
jgi:hypothetical protein